MVCVFPEDVCPYASMVVSMPSKLASTASRAPMATNSEGQFWTAEGIALDDWSGCTPEEA
eukprot:1589897-Rhodomonas_salina.1